MMEYTGTLHMECGALILVEEEEMIEDGNINGRIHVKRKKKWKEKNE